MPLTPIAKVISIAPTEAKSRELNRPSSFRASRKSLIPSLSLSRSRASGVPSPSVSRELASRKPSPSASMPPSSISGMPSLSSSRSSWLRRPSPSVSGPCSCCKATAARLLASSPAKASASRALLTVALSLQAANNTSGINGKHFSKACFTAGLQGVSDALRS